MSKDKRWSCEKIPSWHEGVFFRLLKHGDYCKLVLCDNDGEVLPAGNILSISQEGIIVRHAGVTEAEGLVKINPDNGKIYTNEEYVEHLRNTEMQRTRERQRTAERISVQMPRDFFGESIPEWIINTGTGDEI